MTVNQWQNYKLFARLRTFCAVFRFGEHKNGVEVAVEHYIGIETLALPALETAQYARGSCLDEPRHFGIGEQAPGLLSEDGQPAVGIVTADDLAQELHVTCPALGTKTVRGLVGKEFV